MSDPNLSPSIAGILKRSSLSTQEQTTLAQLTSRAIQQQQDYPWLNRAEGVSFNPLPARLLEILLREGKHEDFIIAKELLNYLPLSVESLVKNFDDKPQIPLTCLALDLARQYHRFSASDETLTQIAKVLFCYLDKCQSQSSIADSQVLKKLKVASNRVKVALVNQGEPV